MLLNQRTPAHRRALAKRWRVAATASGRALACDQLLHEGLCVQVVNANMRLGLWATQARCQEKHKSEAFRAQSLPPQRKGAGLDEREPVARHGSSC
jgi:hypothetical protein